MFSPNKWSPIHFDPRARAEGTETSTWNRCLRLHRLRGGQARLERRGTPKDGSWLEVGRGWKIDFWFPNHGLVSIEIRNRFIYMYVYAYIHIYIYRGFKSCSVLKHKKKTRNPNTVLTISQHLMGHGLVDIICWIFWACRVTSSWISQGFKTRSPKCCV